MSDRSRDVLSFFGSSPTRLTTLEALCDGAVPRSELQELTGTSRITIWRLLSDLEDRGWVRETDGGLVATAAGRLVVERIRSTQEALSTIEALDDLLDWLPLDEMEFPIECLSDVEVVRPTTSDPQGPMRLASRQIEEASTIRILTHGFSPWVIDIMHERGTAGEQTGEIVTSTAVLKAFLEDPTLRSQLRELIEAGRLDYYRYEGSVPHILAILDDERVGMGVDDDAGRPRAALDIEDDIVLAWATRTFEQYKSDAPLLEAARFSG